MRTVNIGDLQAAYRDAEGDLDPLALQDDPDADEMADADAEDAGESLRQRVRREVRRLFE